MCEPTTHRFSPHLAPHVGQLDVAGQHVVDAALVARRLQAQVQRGMGLRIEIDQADSLPGGGQRGAQVDGRGRFAHAPFLIEDGDRSHGRNSFSSPRYREQAACIADDGAPEIIARGGAAFLDESTESAFRS